MMTGMNEMATNRTNSINLSPFAMIMQLLNPLWGDQVILFQTDFHRGRCQGMLSYLYRIPNDLVEQLT
jgi:hypothetical protein